VQKLAPALYGLVATAALSLSYLGLMLAWISIREPLDSPGYVLKVPLREFFWASLVAILLAGVVTSPLLVRWTRAMPARQAFLAFLGTAMLALGLVGMLIILPASASLSSSGGMTPDFGHVLTYENVTGALWLFLLLTAFAPFGLAYAAMPAPRPAWSTLLLLVHGSVPVYVVAYALYVRWEHITAP
jgi:hypothetical protein